MSRCRDKPEECQCDDMHCSWIKWLFIDCRDGDELIKLLSNDDYDGMLVDVVKDPANLQKMLDLIGKDQQIQKVIKAVFSNDNTSLYKKVYSHVVKNFGNDKTIMATLNHCVEKIENCRDFKSVGFNFRQWLN
jgi:hypothetical protein